MKYVLGLEDGRNEPIRDLDNAKRVVLIDKDTVGAEDITFAYCRFEAKTSAHKKHVHKDAEEIIYIIDVRVLVWVILYLFEHTGKDFETEILLVS